MNGTTDGQSIAEGRQFLIDSGLNLFAVLDCAALRCIARGCVCIDVHIDSLIGLRKACGYRQYGEEILVRAAR